jgi:hypothetical protein
MFLSQRSSLDLDRIEGTLQFSPNSNRKASASCADVAQRAIVLEVTAFVAIDVV